MSKRHAFLLAFALAASACLAQGPNEGFIMESEGTQHLLTHADPVYPPIAKAAHVQGSVLLHVSVNEQGRVTAAEAIGGPAMLKAAAIDAVKRWSYKPFEVRGKATAVRVVVSVPFSLGILSATEKSDQAIGQAYFPKFDECRAANASGRWVDAAKSCGEAVEIANRFPDPAQRANEIRSAHENYGEALAFSGNLPDALTEFHKTVEVASKSLTPVDAEYAAAYYWLAFGEHASKMTSDAERDYSTSEASFRKAMSNLPDMEKTYGKELAHTLAYHAVLEKQLGHDQDAATMVAEALKLDPHALDGMGGNAK